MLVVVDVGAAAVCALLPVATAASSIFTNDREGTKSTSAREQQWRRCCVPNTDGENTGAAAGRRRRAGSGRRQRRRRPAAAPAPSAVVVMIWARRRCEEVAGPCGSRALEMLRMRLEKSAVVAGGAAWGEHCGAE